MLFRMQMISVVKITVSFSCTKRDKLINTNHFCDNQMSHMKNGTLNVNGHKQIYFFLFSFATRAGSPQQREPITVGP